MNSKPILPFRDLKKKIAKTGLHLVLSLCGFLFLLPLLWMISTSLKGDLEIFLIPPTWIPKEPVWGNYLRAFTVFPFPVYFGNTAYYAGLCILGALMSSSLIAYGFSRIKWPGRDVVFILVLSTMMLPYQVVMIPLFILFRRLGWVGTLNPLIVPTYFGIPFFIFLMRQFFMTIPSQLSDAARIDGASEFMIYARIVMPLSKPVAAVVVLFEFLGRWNDFIGPLIYINDESKYTLALALQRFVGQFESEWALLMAASSAITIPIIILFFFTQRTFIQGITLTGLKG